MRIALLVTQGEHGGVQDFLGRFMSHLKTQGHQVAVFCGPGDWLEAKCTIEGIRFIRLHKLKRNLHPWFDLQATRELRIALRDYKPDAVHLNSSKIGIIGSLAARRAQVPRIVYRIGGWAFLEDLSPLKKWLYRSAEIFTARFKDIIICVNPDDAEIAKRYGIKPRTEIRCVPNGINTDSMLTQLYTREEARRILKANDHFIFGTIANFYPAKNLPNYIEACAIVAVKNPEARFVIIGDGEERALIENAIQKYNVKNKIILAGAREDADRLYSAFDAFVLPSSKEGMSWALLKAMACGLPCIATDVGAAKWMLDQNTGLLVKPADTNGLATSMQEIITNKSLRTTLGENAQKAVQDRFPLEQTMKGNELALTS